MKNIQPKQLYNEDTQKRTPYMFESGANLRDFEHCRLVFDYGIDLDENLCYLDFSKDLNFFIRQIRCLLKFNNKPKITIICNTSFHNISTTQMDSFIAYLNDIINNNKVEVVLYCRSVVDSNMKSFFFKFKLGKIFVYKDMITEEALQELIQQSIEINLI